ncbi:general odorant-binding protein 45-like [Uranotaenia lowii]|uniref:general odorant-binding protein 45-like n=1 Tax=Uranotaenia lowii TaxID=190385 RepID=UPI002478B8AD|nr:general odorant-binding protein 45-like [Uranotaenia lowii]
MHRVGSIAIVVAFVLQTFLVEASQRHCVMFKTSETILSESLRLLGNQSEFNIKQLLPCQLRGGAILGRIWNDQNGTVHAGVSPRYLRIDNSSTQTFNHKVEECLEGAYKKIPSNQLCLRAEATFNCYVGVAELRLEEPFFIPRTGLQHGRVLNDCIQMLQISSNELRVIRKEGLLNHPQGRCLVRCFLLREDLFCEATGINAFRILVHNGGAKEGIEFRKEGARCIARLQRNYQDRCMTAARIAAECYSQTLWKMMKDGLNYV